MASAAARAAAGAAVAVLVAYLVVAPGAARAIDADVRNQIAWYRDPIRHQQQEADAVALIKGDPVLMTKLASDAEKHLRTLRKQMEREQQFRQRETNEN